jgi:hypothetical protein
MISLSDFVNGVLRWVLERAGTLEPTPPEGRDRGYDAEIS